MRTRQAEEAPGHEVGVRSADRLLLAVRVLGVVFGGTWALGLVAGALGATVFGAMLAAQGKLVFLAGLVAMFVVRGIGSPRDRLAWWCFAAAVGSYLAGALGFELYYRYLPFVPRPSWSDVGYMGFYPFAFAALLLMLRARIRRLTAQTWLDCLVTGLTAAALATAVALGALLRAVDGSLGMLVASIGLPRGRPVPPDAARRCPGRHRPRRGRVLVVAHRRSLRCSSPTDALYAYQVVHGTYTPGGPLDFAWGLAFVCLGLAACQPARAGITSGLVGKGALLVPGICALTALGLLFQGYSTIGDPVAGILALGAVLAALARTGLAFREVRTLADSRQQARTDELTGLANRRSFYEQLAAARPAGRRSTVSPSAARPRPVQGDQRLARAHAWATTCSARSGHGWPRAARGDLLARLGGDEFAVLVDDVDAAGRDGARRAGCAVSSSSRSVGGMTACTIDASIGIAIGPSTRRRRRTCSSSPTSRCTRRRPAARRRGLRRGARRRRPAPARGGGAAAAGHRRRRAGRCTTSPSSRSRRARSSGVEALVRWQHPARGLLFPDAFIDLAESAGLMSRLTSAVVEMALAQCRRWARRGLSAHRLGERQPVQPGRRGRSRRGRRACCAGPAAGRRAGARGDREHPHGGPRARRAGALPAARGRRRRLHRRLRHRLLAAWPTCAGCRSTS